MTAPPDIAYLVCATPRSGSTLLCEMLRATGSAGNPREHFEFLRHSSLPRQPREYFESIADAGVLELLAPLEAGSPSAEPSAAWRARIRNQGQTANGVWGGKLMWGHVADLLARARALDDLADADLASALRALLGEVRFVLVTREDKVAQAVSLWRAVQTRHWSAAAGAPPRVHDASYSFAAIDHLVRRLEADEAAWRAWFADNELGPGRPLHLPYETIAADPRAAVEQVLGFCGLSGIPVADPPLRTQRDARSREWIARYLSDKREAVA